MLKIRLKRMGRKKSPSYRLVVLENRTRRNGKPIEEVGFYNPVTKKCWINIGKIDKWLKYGAKPTKTVFNLLKKTNSLKIIKN